jgi:hypothetical protein
MLKKKRIDLSQASCPGELNEERLYTMHGSKVRIIVKCCEMLPDGKKPTGIRVFRGNNAMHC